MSDWIVCLVYTIEGTISLDGAHIDRKFGATVINFRLFFHIYILLQTQKALVIYILKNISQGDLLESL